MKHFDFLIGNSRMFGLACDKMRADAHLRMEVAKATLTNQNMESFFFRLRPVTLRGGKPTLQAAI